jgi:beta-galactosidase
METYPYRDFVFACEYDPFLYSEEQWRQHLQWLANCGINQVHFGRGMWALSDTSDAEALVRQCIQFADLVAGQGMSVVVSAGTDRLPTRQATAWQGSPQGVQAVFLGARKQWLTALVAGMGEHPARAGWSLHPAEVEIALGIQQPDCEAGFRLWLEQRFDLIEQFNQQLFPDYWAAWKSDWQAVGIPSAKDPLPLRLAYLEYGEQQRHLALSAFAHEWLELDEEALLFNPGELDTAHGSAICVIAFDAGERMDTDAARLDAVLPAVTTGQMQTKPFVLNLTTRDETHAPLWQSNPDRLQSLIWRAFLAGAQGVLWPQFLAVPGCDSKGLPLLPVHHADSLSQSHPISVCREWMKERRLCQRSIIAECALISPAIDSAGLVYRDAGVCSAMLEDYRQAFRSLGIACATIDSQGDFSQFKVIFAPVMPYVDAPLLEQLIAFVQRGGLLVTGFETAVMNPQGVPLDPALLALWERLVGLSVTASLPYPDLEGLSVKMLDGRIVKAGSRCESLRLHSAIAMANYSNGPFAGSPALAVNTLGNGRVFYLGMRPKSSFYRYALADLADQLDLRRPAIEVGDGVEIVELRLADGLFYAIFNTGTEPAIVDWKTIRGTDLLSGKACRGRITLSATEKLWVRVSE